MSYLTGPSIIVGVTATGTARSGSGILYSAHLTTTSGSGSATVRSGGVSGPILATLNATGGGEADFILVHGVAFNGELHVSAISGTGARLELEVG